jgi:hypothetical protein
MVFEKNANFFVENCPNSEKIVIITLTPEVDHFWTPNAATNDVKTSFFLSL